MDTAAVTDDAVRIIHFYLELHFYSKTVHCPAFANATLFNDDSTINIVVVIIIITVLPASLFSAQFYGEIKLN